MKKITFNNMAITEHDVMNQILQLEQEREDKERKKEERKKSKEERDLQKSQTSGDKTIHRTIQKRKDRPISLKSLKKNTQKI